LWTASPEIRRCCASSSSKYGSSGGRVRLSTCAMAASRAACGTAANTAARRSAAPTAPSSTRAQTLLRVLMARRGEHKQDGEDRHAEADRFGEPGAPRARLERPALIQENLASGYGVRIARRKMGHVRLPHRQAAGLARGSSGQGCIGLLTGPSIGRSDAEVREGREDPGPGVRCARNSGTGRGLEAGVDQSDGRGVPQSQRRTRDL
jgi:hypothetical protein